MSNLKILIVFINQFIYNKREKFYKNLIKKISHKNKYFEIILLGINENLQIKVMNRIETHGPNNEYWELPYCVGESFKYLPEQLNFSFEKILIDCLNHFKSEKNIQQIEYCIDINLNSLEISIRNFIKNKHFEDFIINEISLIELIK